MSIYYGIFIVNSTVLCVFIFYLTVCLCRNSLTEYSAPFYLEKGTWKTRELNQCVFPNKTSGIKDVFGCSVVLSAGDLSLLLMTPHWSLGLCDTKGSRWALVSSFLFLSLH